MACLGIQWSQMNITRPLSRRYHANTGTIIFNKFTFSTVKVGNFDHLMTFKIVKYFPTVFRQFFYMKMTVYYGTSGIRALTQDFDRRSNIFFKKCWVVDLTLDRPNFDHQ
jgi:hypothetical protein